MRRGGPGSAHSFKRARAHAHIARSDKKEWKWGQHRGAKKCEERQEWDDEDEKEEEATT